ncbi:pentapeptide repeat-containing protein [Actinomadura soli]|uniref:Pentapeptide repeat-containing protein n=1 Tax=Actinomadura soli TaxID=2508997 RepID=A0A5C4JD51_9ACTN|nr:pentapeptide repeat-containing protein [Actinomadura soli]TMQ99254.1 pentapeptide repeat-containing protein [Actinomadura soli]
MRLLMAAVVSALAGGVLLLLWRGPWWFDGKYLKGADFKSSPGALVTGFRTAVVQVLVGLGAVVALLYTARNYRLTRRGQVTDRFIKALERLGSDEMYVRLGGVLALEQIIQDAPEQATHAAQVLVAFIRDRAPRSQARTPPPSRGRIRRAIRRGGSLRRRASAEADGLALPVRPAEDVQAALTALTLAESRRHVALGVRINLEGLHLQGVELFAADLARVHLRGADLTDATIIWADFTDAWLGEANFTRATLRGTDFTDAWLGGAIFTDADMEGVNLTRASLLETDLTRASLAKADLTGASLLLADLSDVNLAGVNLSGVDLSGADPRLRRLVRETEAKLTRRPGRTDRRKM